MFKDSYATSTTFFHGVTMQLEESYIYLLVLPELNDPNNTFKMPRELIICEPHSTRLTAFNEE